MVVLLGMFCWKAGTGWKSQSANGRFFRLMLPLPCARRGASCWLISGHAEAENPCIWFRTMEKWGDPEILLGQSFLGLGNVILVRLVVTLLPIKSNVMVHTPLESRDGSGQNPKRELVLWPPFFFRLPAAFAEHLPVHEGHWIWGKSTDESFENLEDLTLPQTRTDCYERFGGQWSYVLLK